MLVLLAALMLAGASAAACARVEGPDVFPREIESAQPATPVVEPSAAHSPVNDTAWGISTRTPLDERSTSASSEFGQWDPDAAAQRGQSAAPAEGSQAASAAPQSSSVSGSVDYSEPVAADARGSLPGLQPVRMKAVWVATVLNIDFPEAVGDAEAQKQECLQILDNARSWELDTVIFQARPMGDALYRSELNPWSQFLTGEQGRDPGWDPLAFMVEEAHKRGLSLHVWLNPYRVAHSSLHIGFASLNPSNFAVQHPEWVISYDGGLYLDPAVPQVREHIADTVREIIENYDVDGIHFDDYFYPSGYPLPPGAGYDGVIAQERRTNVTEMIRMVHDTINSVNPRIVFGISPSGIWKNSTTDPEGSNTQGGESYYDQAADSLNWARLRIIDYIAPQLYWPIGFDKADYRELTAWWADKIRGTGVSLIIGQGVYVDEIAAEIADELRLNLQYPEITGSIFFSYKDLAANPACAEAVRRFYSE